MIERIFKLMESQQMTQKMFSQFTTISEGTLSGLKSGRTKPTLEIVEKIRSHFPKLNIEWLLYGTGRMFKDDAASKSPASPTSQLQGGDGSSSASSIAAAVAGGQPGLFDAAGQPNVVPSLRQGSDAPQIVVKHIDKPVRKITEIRVFFDDQTWESFVPKPSGK